MATPRDAQDDERAAIGARAQTANRTQVGGSDNDTLYGGDDDDTLFGRDRNDRLFGRDGDDRLLGEQGNDALYGQDDDDRLYGGDRDDRLFGGSGNDLLVGDAGDDRLYGGTGNDRLYGGDGRDVLLGDAGNDTIDGGEGDDRAYGGAGNDRLVGRAGNDLLRGDAGDDRLYGGEGSDRLYGGDGKDLLAGGAGDDTIDGGEGSDRLYGEAGNDRLVGREGSDLMRGAAGDDRLYGGEGGDRLYGEAGDDLLLGEAGNDLASGGDGNDRLYGGAGIDLLLGGDGNDLVVGEAGIDILVGGDGNDRLFGGDGNDVLSGEAGDDRVLGDAGNDIAIVNVSTDGADRTDLGEGDDTVLVGGAAELRLTFTSAEVGNGSANDGGVAAGNQDGGLAVRMQAEDGSGNPTGPVGRYDDEGVTFLAAPGTTFDVRDLVSGVQRGNQFNVVTLGTSGADVIAASGAGASANDYINAGMGDDTVTAGAGADFLVGGGGNDSLAGGAGDDRYIGGGGNDTITDTDGGVDEVAAFNVTTDGGDQVDLGAGQDVFSVGAAAATNVRLTFTSADVGNGAALDGNNADNEDGNLAVRLQAEAGGTPEGSITRVEDEGITFVGGAGVTFDVRDLPTGTQRGEAFEVVVLGTSGDDTLNAVQPARPYYTNGGGGNDTIGGGTANDFLVGGAGNDGLTGGAGVDSLLGGAGTDSFYFATNDTGRQSAGTADTILTFAAEDTIFLQGIYAFAGEEAPDAGEYSITGAGGGFLLTYNDGGTLHDIVVTGADPTGRVDFY